MEIANYNGKLIGLWDGTPRCNFEMYKDLIESAMLSTKIIKLIGKRIQQGLLMNYF